MKRFSLIAAFASLILLSGCITIFEKYTIHANGTGTMEYIIDMSEMYEMMAAFSDSTEEMDTTDFDASLREAVPGLRNMDGISNVELTGDIAKYIAGIKFDFKDVNSLNNALNLILNGNEEISENQTYVEMKGKSFTRFGLTSEEFNKEDMLGSEGDGLDEETMKSVLESMKYNISVNFDKPVKKIKTLAEYTQVGNTVTSETNFSKIFDNEEVLKLNISTK